MPDVGVKYLWGYEDMAFLTKQNIKKTLFDFQRF